MEEIWKPIRNHENFYLVSNLGRVKRLLTTFKRKDGKNYKRPEKILKPYKVVAIIGNIYDIVYSHR